MANLHRLQVTSETLGTSHGTKILLDGIELKGATAIRLSASVENAWCCEIEFLPGALEVHVQAEVETRDQGQPVDGALFVIGPPTEAA